MQQTIHLNIVDSNIILPATSDSLSVFFPLLILAVAVAVPLLFCFRRNIAALWRSHSVRALSCFVLPLLGIGGLLVATNPVNQAVPSEPAIAISSVDDVSVDVDANSNYGSSTFAYAIAPGSWSEGYNLLATAASDLPAGVTISIDQQNITKGTTALVRKYRLLQPDTESLTVEVTVPAGTQIQQDYAVVYLNYTAIDWYKYYTFQTSGPIDPEAATYYDSTPGTGTCGTEMSVYPSADNKPDTVILRDLRNNQDYRVRKFPDGHCWMIDNLKLDNYNTTTTDSDGTVSLPAATVSALTLGTAPQVFDPTAACNSATVSSDYAGLLSTVYDPASFTGCGYLYNWCAATADNSANCGVSGTMANSAMSTSICPIGWKLPHQDGSSTAPAYSYNDYYTLRFAMEAASSSSYYHNSTIQPSDYQRNFWPNGAFAGALSGFYINRTGNPSDPDSRGFSFIGEASSSWSADSTNSPFETFSLQVGATEVLTRSGVYNFKYVGLAVRCFN